MLEQAADPTQEPLAVRAVEGGYLVSHGPFAAVLTRDAIEETARRFVQLVMQADEHHPDSADAR